MVIDLHVLGKHPGPEAQRHARRGLGALDREGRPAERQDGRWDFAAPAMAPWCGCGWVGSAQVQQRVEGGDRRAWDQAHRRARAAMDLEWETHVRAEVPTLAVFEAKTRVVAAERDLDEAVHEARSAGASWAQVAATTGTARQVAHKRWGGAKDVIPREERSKGGRPRRAAARETGAGSTAQASPASSSTTAAPDGAVGTGNGAERGAQGPAAGTGAGRGRSARGGETGRQVRRLEQALSQRHGVDVSASWEGTRSRDGRRGGWSMTWRGGPTRADMRADAALVVAEDPALAGLELDDLTWHPPQLTDPEHAALTLEWLRAHPDQGDRVGHLTLDDLTGWPEHLPAELRAHGETLAAAGWGYQRAGAAADTLHAHAADGGYDAVAAWLTDMATGQDADLVDLRTRRTTTIATPG